MHQGREPGTYGNPADLAHYIEHLESPERAAWQMPDRVVAALRLRPGQVVADLGAGSGYFALRLARKVGKPGHVFAVDVEPAVLNVLRERVARQKAVQVTPVLGLPENPLLPPASCDCVLSVNAYHHFPAGPAALRRMASLLRRGGRLALIDFHKRETGMGPPMEERIARETFLKHLKHIEKTVLRVEKELTFLPHQYFFLLR